MFVAIAIVTLLMMVLFRNFKRFSTNVKVAFTRSHSDSIGISDLFSSSPILVLGGMFGTVLGLFLFKKTKPGSKTFDWLALNVPAVKDVAGKSNISRIT